MPDTLLTVEELAERTKVPVRTVYAWNHRGTGPKYMRLAGGGIRYRSTDVEKWLEQQAVDQAS